MTGTPATVGIRNVGDRFTLELHGEFDVATVDVLTNALRHVNVRGPALVAVDLRDATFFGLTALDAVLAAHAELAARGCMLDLVNTTRSVGKMLTALDAEHLLSQRDPVLVDACTNEASLVAPAKLTSATA